MKISLAQNQYEIENKIEVCLSNSWVAFVTDLYRQGYQAMVAAYPDVHQCAQSVKHDLRWLKRRQNAGGGGDVPSRNFLSPESYLCFREQVIASNITIPIIPGIMPIHSVSQVMRFTQNCGINIPSNFIKRFSNR